MSECEAIINLFEGYQKYRAQKCLTMDGTTFVHSCAIRAHVMVNTIIREVNYDRVYVSILTFRSYVWEHLAHFGFFICGHCKSYFLYFMFVDSNIPTGERLCF